MTSVVVPLKIDGVVKGMIGIDLDLTSLSALTTSVSLGESGYLSLVSHGGLYAAHPDAERLATPYADSDTWARPFLPEIAAGRAFEARNESSTLGGESIRLGTPIRIHGTDTPWSVVANLSRNEALAPVFAVRNLVVVTGAAVLLVMCGILVWLVASIARP